MAKKEYVMAKKKSAGYDAVLQAKAEAEAEVSTYVSKIVRLEAELNTLKNQVVLSESKVVSLENDLKKLEKNNG